MPEVRLATPLKYSHPKGTVVTVVDQYISKATGDKTWFTAPKIDGVYFAKAVSFFNRAVELRDKVLKTRGLGNPTDPEQGYAFIDKDNLVFEFFTEACSGIILLFATTESLANSLIENAPQLNYSKEKKVKLFSIGKFSLEIKKKQQLSLEQLLFLGIEEKLKNVLPTLYGFKSPTEKVFWQDFKNLKMFRDGFIHSTKNQSYGAHKGENSLYAQLFDMDYQKLVDSISELLIFLKGGGQEKSDNKD